MLLPDLKGGHSLRLCLDLKGSHTSMLLPGLKGGHSLRLYLDLKGSHTSRFLTRS